jgi:hypothetical protein
MGRENAYTQGKGVACGFVLALGVLASVLLAMAQNHKLSQAWFDYARDEDTIVIQLRRDIAMIDEPDPIPLLRVYGNGWVQVHFPKYMKRAGDYGLQLTEAEMTALLSSLAAKGLIHFDQQETHQLRLRAMQQQGTPTRVHRSDEDVTFIEIRLDSYQPADASMPIQHNVRQTIAWSALRSDAQRYPSVEAIQNLAAAVEELEALTEREDLVKLSNE